LQSFCNITVLLPGSAKALIREWRAATAGVALNDRVQQPPRYQCGQEMSPKILSRGISYCWKAYDNRI